MQIKNLTLSVLHINAGLYSCSLENMYVTPKIFGVALKQSHQISGLFHQSEVRFLFGAPTADSGVSFIVPFLWRKSSAPKEGTFQIGFTNGLYIQVRACYLKTAAGKKAKGDLVKFK